MEIKPVHVLLGAAGAVGAYLIYKQVSAPAAAAQLTSGAAAPPVAPLGTTNAPPTPVASVSSFNMQAAKIVMLDGSNPSIFVRPGTSLHFSKTAAFGGSNWASQGCTSSYPQVLAPVPGSISDFVAIAEGTSMVVGYWTDTDGSVYGVKANVFVTNSAPAT